MTRKTPSSAEFGGGKKALALLIGKLCGIAAVSNASYAGPAGGVVTAGEGAISTPTNTSTLIDQASNRLSIDWQSFDVAANESVRFNQPTSNSVALNRILDLKPSEVFGRIDANGRVVLFNSHGIMFGPGSQVNVGSLLATSLNVVSYDDATGQLRLQALGSPGSIVNNGTIVAGPGGSVSLVGGAVSNNGHIVADLGSVNLAAGRAATLDFYGGGLLRFEADSTLLDNPGGAAAGVANAGTISADGGQVLLTTSAAQNVFSRAVNNDGLVSANRIENVGGAIRLVGAGGTVVNSGVLDASGVGAGSTGGSVQVLGQNVGLFGNARVDVSGDAGGGVALIGGDYQGSNSDVLNAAKTFVGSDAQVVADARVSGDGGRVILWSDEVTRFHGGISARGGAESGDGGFVEVSSLGSLNFNGLVRVGAPAGNGGQLLLDPADIEIVADGLGTDAPNINFADVTASDPALVEASAIVNALDPDTLVFLRATNSITVSETIDARPRAGAEGGDLELSANIVNLDADIFTRNGDIFVNALAGDITFDSAGIELNSGTGGITLSSQGALALGTLSGGAIDVTSVTQSVSQISGATLTGRSLDVTANTNIALTTAINTSGAPTDTLSATAGTSLNITNTGSLRVASADAGTPLTISNTGAMIVSNASAPGEDVSLQATGDLTVGMVNGGTVTITSTNGAILDAPGGTAISADTDITLNAETGIGVISAVDLLAGNAGTPLTVNTAGDLSATVDQANGEINLDLAQIPAGTWTIDLGGGGVASGRILLQRSSPFNVDADVPADLFDLGTGNTAQVGLRSTGLLTLPNDMQDIFVDAPGALAVTGANIEDAGGGPIIFDVGTLAFHSGSASNSQILDTTVGSLIATIGNGASLEVNETDAITLTNVQAQNVDVLSNGTMTVTAVNANATTGTVILAAGAANAINGGTVVGNQLTINAANGVNLNTDVSSFTATTVGGGGIVINETSGPLSVTNATSTGGLVDISTAAGNLTVTTASGNGVTLDAANNLTVNGTVDSNAGLATLTAGNQLTTTLGTVSGAAANLTSNGAMALGTVNIVGTVTLAAGASGAISGGTVNATQLNINSASSVNLDTDVNTINANNVGSGGITIDEVDGPLSVTNANSTGAVDISTGTGAMTVTNASGNAITLDSATALTVNGTVSAGAGLATLTAGTTLTTTAGTLNAGSAGLTSNGAMALGAVNSGGVVTLAAGAAGAITGGTVSGTALTVNSASGVNLNTNVNTFNATTLIGPGGITLNEASGPLSVTNANSTGAVDISTTAGNLTVTTASGNALTLDAGGALTVNGTVSAGAGLATLTAGSTLTTTAGIVNAGSANLTSSGAMGLGAVNVNTVTGTATLAAGTGAITGGTVDGNQLTISNAGSVALATDVNSFTAVGIGGGGITIVEESGPLTVTSATSIGGAVDISTIAGNLTVTNASGAGVTLHAGSAGNSGDSNPTGNLTIGTVGVTGPATATATLIADGSITINTSVNAGPTRDVTLRARDGAIGDNTGNTIPSVVADQLTIDVADAVELDTNLVSLAASGVTNGLTIREQNADLAVSNAVAGGAVDISTPFGNLAVTNASGTTVALTAGTTPGTPGTLSATTVNATAGAANLTSNGTMTVGNVSGVGATLTANGATSDLTVTGTVNSGAGAASLTAGRAMAAGNVTATTAASLTAGTTLTTNAVNVTGAGGSATLNSGGSMTPTSITTNGGNITLSASGAGAVITLATVDAGAGVVAVTAANGSITDDDDGTAQTTQVTGSSVALTAATAIGTVTTFETAAGRSVDVNTSGPLTAYVTTNVAGPVGGQINLNIAGSPDIVQDGIRLGNIATTNRTGRVLLQSASDLDLGTLDPGTINVGASNAASVGYVSGGVLTLPVASLTDTSPVNLLISGTDVLNPGGTRIIGLSADTAVFNASAAGGDFTLNTSVGTLHSNVGNRGLTVNESLDGITLGGITASTLTVNANTAAASILDDSDDSTVINAGTITLDTTNVIGGAGLAALDVDADNLVATTDNGGITVNSVGAGPLQVNVTSFGGDVSLLAAGDVGVTGLSGANVNLDVAGAVTDAPGSTPSVAAIQLAIAGAASADLDTNVSILNATGVTGALNIREQTGPLAVTNASAGTTNLSTVAGALTVTNAASTSGALTLAAGGAGSALTVTNASGNGANLTAGGDIILGTVNAGAGTATLAAGGAISDAVGPGPSIIAGQLAIASAASADLDTNVNSLAANNVTGALTIREQNGDLAVTSANAGTVDLSTVAGALTNVSASAGSVALTASTGISLDSVTSTGAATLTAGGAITDAAGAAPSVNADQLTIAAASADLDTNVNTLTANVTGALAIRDQAGALAVVNATAGTGASLSSAGNLSLGTVTAGTATLAAGGAITDAAGATPSVVAGTLTITGAGSADLDTNVNTLDASGVTGALAVREQTGALAVTNASATGAVNVSTVAGALGVTSAAGNGVTLTAGGAGSGLTLGTLNAGTGTATLAAGGAITDGAGVSVTANQLTITGAASADLDTNVNTLNASGVTGNLTVREQAGALAVANAASTGGAVNVSTVAGALTNVNATGTNVTLTAGGAGSGISLGTVNANTTTGTVALVAPGAITDAAGATPSVVANQLTITGAASADLDTNVNALSATGIGGALTIREQSGALTVANAASAGAVNLSTIAGALTVTNVAGNGVSLNAGGAGSGLTIGTVNAGATGTATLAAGGAIIDAAGTAPSVVANQLTITGAVSADLDTNVNTLNASGVSGNLTVREQAGALAVANAASTGGAIDVSTVAGALTNVNATGTNVTLTAGGAGNGISLGTVNGTTGTVTLTTGGAVTDAAGTAASVVANQLTISGAASVDLDTNVNTLTTNGVTGALSVREQAGALTVTNATSTGGAVNLSTVAGAMTVTNVAGNGVTLNAGGAGSGLTLGAVNAGTGTVSLAAGGAITDAPGATPSVVASTLTITGAGSADLDTNVDTLNASNVTGALGVREQTGALTVANASAAGAVNVSTVNGNLTVTTAASSGGALTLAAGGAGSTLNLTNGSGTSANLTSGGNMVIASNTLNVGTGNASLSAGGTLTDGTAGTALTAGAATLSAASIGTAANTFDVSVNSLSATTSSGGMFINESNDITLTNLSATASNQDIVVGALGSITVNQISNASGRVLLAGNRDILSTGNGTHITAQSVELRAGRDTSGGRVGTATQPLRISGPPTVAGGANGTGDPVPNILVLQNQSAPGSQEAAQTEQLDLDSDGINISRATFDPSAAALPASAFLTTTFSIRTASGTDRVTVANAPFDVNGALNGDAQVGLSTRGAGALLTASGASNAQGEGTLYIDWASFDPNVSLFGTVNPPICLPRDQAEEDDGSSESTGGCASTTAQYDGSFRMPEVKLVITSRGVEWVTVPSGNVTVFPLIGQIR